MEPVSGCGVDVRPYILAGTRGASRKRRASDCDRSRHVRWRTQLYRHAAGGSSLGTNENGVCTSTRQRSSIDEVCGTAAIAIGNEKPAWLIQIYITAIIGSACQIKHYLLASCSAAG